MRGCLGLFSLTLLSASRLAWSPRVPVFLRPHQIASGKADPGSIRVLFATVNSSPDSGRDQAGPSAWWVEKCSAPLATWGHFRSRGPLGKNVLPARQRSVEGDRYNFSVFEHKACPDYRRPFQKPSLRLVAQATERSSVSGTTSSFKLLHFPRPIGK